MQKKTTKIAYKQAFNHKHTETHTFISYYEVNLCLQKLLSASEHNPLRFCEAEA